MDEYEYMWLSRWIFTQYFIDENQTEQLFINNIILIKHFKRVYGLPQAGGLAYNTLIKHLQLHGYTCAGFTPGHFKHSTRNTMFCLVFDYFGLKYTAKNDALHLIDTLKKNYPGITIDWSDTIYLRIDLDWGYNRCTVTNSMPNYVNKSLSIFQH